MAKSSRKKQTTDTKQTKKQLAIGRKQAKQNRIIWLSVAGVALLIVAILAVAVIMEVLVKPGEAVAVVNGHKIRSDDFEDLLSYRRYNQHLNILNLETGLQELDPQQEGNEFLISFYQQQLAQLQSELALAPQNTLEELIDDELIREKAEELGLAVVEGEVTEAINEDLRQAVAPAAQSAITDTEQVPTPTPVPQEQLDAIYQNALANMGLTDKAFERIVQRSLLGQKVQDVLASQVVTTGLVARVQLIQTDTEAEAVAAQGRIESGEDFALVAQEVSTDTLSAADGGDLGWVTTGQLSPRYGEAVEDEVFSMEIGKLALLESDGKFFLLTVLERDENGPLPDSVVLPLQSGALDSWLTEKKASPDIEIERFLEPDQIPPDPFATAPAS
jgi:parvulin-like peptidyl-prolyl isomerase